MKKLLFSLFSIFILLALPLQARKLDMSMLNKISNDLKIPTIIGNDDRKEITGRASKSELPVVIVELDTDEYTFLCSGVMVWRNIVLTAAHCISEAENEGEIEVYAVGVPNQESFYNKVEEATWLAYDSGELAFPYATAKKIWIPNEYKEAINSNDKGNSRINKTNYDYALIALDYNLGDITDWSKLKIMSDEELNGKNIVLIGRASDKSEYSLWKSPGRIKETDKYVVYHDADTLTGNSGCPVFEANNSTNIIALHNWDYTPEDVSLSYNVGLRIRQEIIDAVENAKSGKLKMYSLSNTD